MFDSSAFFLRRVRFVFRPGFVVSCPGVKFIVTGFRFELLIDGIIHRPLGVDIISTGPAVSSSHICFSHNTYFSVPYLPLPVRVIAIVTALMAYVALPAATR